MKIIEVKEELFDERHPDPELISERLDLHGSGHLIDTINWNTFSYKPDVRFNIAYRDKEIYLKYYVREEYIKAEKTMSNDRVWEDSCVEFFITPGDDLIYYNFEFNAIGTCLSGAGIGRNNRISASPETIGIIRRECSLGTKPFPEKHGEFFWTITLAIPTYTFFQHRIDQLKGKSFRANFYKCGDKLTRVHYLTWNRIDTMNPDYHQPEYFGLLKFV